jgi:hypothetical protein
VVNESAHQGEQRRRLHITGVTSVKEIEHNVHMNLARKELARRRVKQKHPLDQVQGGEDQFVVLLVFCAHSSAIISGPEI